MKIKAFNILNQNGNPASNQLEILVHNENTITNIFQSYNCIIAQINYNTECNNILIIDNKAYVHSITTTKHLNIWMDNNGIDHKEVRKIFNKGGGILKGEYKDLNIVISDLN